MLGERAALEGGTRTSTLVAVTPCRVAVVPRASSTRRRWAEPSAGHRREDAVAADDFALADGTALADDTALADNAAWS